MATNPTATTDLETALRTTGAIRDFTDRGVTRAELARILDVARFAPSGGNMQPWHVVSVEAPERRAALGRAIVVAAREYVTLRAAGQRPFGHGLDLIAGGHGRFEQAVAAGAERLDLHGAGPFQIERRQPSGAGCVPDRQGAVITQQHQGFGPQIGDDPLAFIEVQGDALIVVIG